MHTLYSYLIRLVNFLLPIVGKYNSKLNLAIEGRTHTLDILKNKINPEQPVIWMHAASLGEYEQGVPVIEALQNKYPNHQWVISFFSPSGYEIKKNNAFAKATIYLPLDTPSNVKLFLDAVSPDMAFFIKYEFWPNYLKELKQRKVRTFLISGIFNERQPFFAWYGSWMTKALNSFEYFFLQDKASAMAIEKLGFTNYTVSGDTRFDRVRRQIEVDNTLPFIEQFKQSQLCVVCGSTWPEDEELLVSFINHAPSNTKFIIAPHEIKPEKIAALESKLLVRTVRYSQHTDESLLEARVLIVDTIGLLTRIYSYADIAYVGGAVGSTGLHNILEPATFGLPIVTGSTIQKFPEAQRLQKISGLFVIEDDNELSLIFTKLLTDANFRNQTGIICGHFINNNTGATHRIMSYLS